MKKNTKTVKIGNLKIGSRYPVRIKGMLKTPVKYKKRLIREAQSLEQEGAEAIRVAVRQKADAHLASFLKKHISVPLVADIHFHADLAFSAIENDFESIRLNPLNISKKSQVKAIANVAKERGVSIRVGVNSGGFRKKFSSPYNLARQMVKKCEDYVKTLEGEGLFDIMVSLKGSDPVSTIIANRLFAERNEYPLHLGVTATGPFLEGVVKSSVGLGSLLKDNIGSIIRVSLTAPSFWEIRVAKYILQALNLREFGPEIISCPTCSRCEVDLISIVDKLKKNLDAAGIDKALKIAIMGCIVNGPGEAYQADIGVAFGKKKAVIFEKDDILKNTTDDRVVQDLIKEVKRYGYR